MEQILKDRQIDSLLHFTRVENLSNILEHGLLPRSILEFNGINFSYNDNYRYDNCKNAVCTTIEFPNYKMFYPLRLKNPEVDWVVLLLDAKIISDLDCAFCSTNAGSAEMYTIPIKNRKGKKALLRLFEELPNGPSRKELGIWDFYPTDPQAEVLVLDCIPATYIISLNFQNQAVLNKYKDIIPIEISSKVSSRAFTYREDWNHW